MAAVREPTLVLVLVLVPEPACGTGELQGPHCIARTATVGPVKVARSYLYPAVMIKVFKKLWLNLLKEVGWVQ